MTIYKVTYEGLHLGGVAVVIANSKEEATRLVEQDPKTDCWGRPEVETITEYFYSPQVLYNNNGDY